MNRVAKTIPEKHITAAMTSIAAVIVPIAALAAESDITKILNNTKDLLNLVIKILITLALVIFIWGIVQFIAAAGNPQKIRQAKGTILYGIIAIAILAMMTGIIAFFQTYFGIQGGVPINIPQF